MTRFVTIGLLGAGSCALFVACGAAKPEVREPEVARVVSLEDAAAPVATMTDASPVARTDGPRFSLFVGGEACVLVDGQLHCRSEIAGESPLSHETPKFGGVADPPVRSVAFGRDFTCAAMQGGEVRCVGGNDRGQLRAGLRDPRRDVAVRVPGAQGATLVFAGAFTACAIMADARVACWGKNDSGESGNGTNYLSAARELVVPEIVPGISDAISIAMAWDTTCAVLRNKEVHCWGRSRTDDQIAQRGETNEKPARFDAMSGTTQLDANESVFCGVKDGDVTCFGDTSMLVPTAEGAFGRRASVAKVGIDHARKVSLGSNHGCALKTGGAVYCFGIDADGALGVPSKGGYMPVPPVKVDGLPPAIDVVTGGAVSCAITESDEAYCWGRFSFRSNDGMHEHPVKIRVTD